MRRRKPIVDGRHQEAVGRQRTVQLLLLQSVAGGPVAAMHVERRGKGQRSDRSVDARKQAGLVLDVECLDAC